MRRELLAWIACPLCRRDLTVQPFESSGDHVTEGLLRCGCGAAYPIVGSIPRLLAEAFQDRPAFVRKHQAALRARMPKNLVDFDKALVEDVSTTKVAYGNWWKKMQRDQSYHLDNEAIFEARTGVPPSELAGKLVFDAGCGGGRFLPTYVAAGAKAVLAMDLSTACEMAADHAAAHPNVHVIQGNLLMPPVKTGTFDHTVTFGVLMITPDPQRGFRELAHTVKVGGRLSIYVYERPMTKWDDPLPPDLAWYGFGPLRGAVSNLPHPLLEAFCRGLWAKRRFAEGIRRLGFRRIADVIARVPPDAYKPMENAAFNVVRNYDMYACKYTFLHSVEEVLEWYREEGYNDVVVTPYRVAATGTRFAEAGEPLRVKLHRKASVEEIESRGVRVDPADGPPTDRSEPATLRQVL